jgi:hypothetical protein
MYGNWAIAGLSMLFIILFPKSNMVLYSSATVEYARLILEGTI